MAETDSFISEVSEEVRRDRVFAFFRRWGWAMALLVLLIVGAAGYGEYRRVQAENAAQGFGNAVLSALDAETPADRISQLDAIEPAGPGAEMLLALLVAGQEADAGSAEAAAERLRAVAGRDDMPERYRDLALLKAHLLAPGERAEAEAMLDRLARPGSPYRPLAIEQQAYLMIQDGDSEGGMALLQQLISEAGSTPGLQQRVLQLMVALESGAFLSEAPLPEETSDAQGLPLAVGVEDAGDPAEAAPGTDGDATDDIAAPAADETVETPSE